MGYFHGYKGYRFARSAANRLPATDFAQIGTVYDFDMQLKVIFYPQIMKVETALKNYTLEAVLEDSSSERFEDIWKRSLTGYRDARPGRQYRDAWQNRYRLRGTVDRLITLNNNSRDVIRHFRDADKDIPIWALFEVMSLGDFGQFYKCLSRKVKLKIAEELGMPTNWDSTHLLQCMIFTLKDLRNAVAHNGAVFDARFKTGGIDANIGRLLQQEMGAAKLDIKFDSITDYLLLIVYLMVAIKLPKSETRRFVRAFEDAIEQFRANVPLEIYSLVFGTETRGKIRLAKHFVASGK